MDTIKKVKLPILIIVITVIALFAYTFQRPVLTTWEAVQQAAEYLHDPSPEWGVNIELNVKPEELPPEDIRTSLAVKQGFFSRLMNRRVWEVTIKYESTEPSVVIDAITGKFIEIYGPVS